MTARHPTALVTGGNRGLGLETCRQLADRGYAVLLCARDEAKAVDAARSLGQGAAVVRGLLLDVTDPDGIAALSAQLERDSVQLDALVNNAGVALDGFDAGVVERTLATNFFGAENVTQALLPLMAPHGRIVMVSSGMGALSAVSHALAERFGDPRLDREALHALLDEFARSVAAGRHRAAGWPGSAYAVSKVALGALVRVLHRELGGSGVLVNAVCPGWVRTGMGGRHAPLGVREGADSIVWAATLRADGPSGVLLRERKQVAW